MRRYNEDEGMNQDPNFWTQWLPASLELHTLQWATLLAAAALLGYVLQRHWHIPKVVLAQGCWGWATPCGPCRAAFCCCCS